MRAAGWLGLAAAPAFALMAVLTAVAGGGRADMLCSAAPTSALGEMAAMYALMARFTPRPGCG